MKNYGYWSYSPYRPYFFDAGDIYICRVVPHEDSIHFEWLSEEKRDSFQVFYRKRGDEAFSSAGKTDQTFFDIMGLDTETDYEFYVTSNEEKSRIRLARCGKGFQTTVNYLHPDDPAYSFSGRYLCSPSLVRHPDGYLLASMDVFEANAPQNLSLLFRSDDEGETWHYVSELFPCFWGKLFIYNNELYMLSCSTEYGDVLIGKSTDGGKTFCEPTVLARGSNGKAGEAGYHKNPQPVVTFKGRIWNTLEYGSWSKGYHAPMVMSAPIGSDLLNAESWTFSKPLKYDPDWAGLPKGETTGNIEGCLVEKDGALFNIMRYDMRKMKPNFGYVIAYQVDTDHPEAPLIYDHCIRFPCNHSKFEMKYDDRTKKYYSIASRITDESQCNARNLLSLMASEDLENWFVVEDLADRTDCDPNKVGFQYADFIIENDRILYLTRVGINGANNMHNANYASFGSYMIRRQ